VGNNNAERFYQFAWCPLAEHPRDFSFAVLAAGAAG